MPESDPQRVPYPLPCVGCGYDLVGLAEDGVCPECGVAIGRSVSGDHLFASSKEYREKLARGARLAVWGAWAGWVSLGLLGPYWVAIGAAFAPRFALAWAWTAGVAIGLALHLSGRGWLLLTGDDPDRIGDGTRPWARWLVLRLYAGGLAYLAPPLVLAWLGFVTWRGVAGLAAVPLLVALVVVVALGLSHAMAREIASLARRLLEGDLADRTRGLKLAGYGAIGLVLLAYAILSLGRAWLWFGLGTLVLAVIVVLAWAIQYHTLVRSLRAALIPVAARP
jgi:hypothetical protein